MVTTEDEVLEFINRRFSGDCHWTDGNCYWFAKILCDRFDYLKIGYEAVVGHFIAYGNGKYYDWHGEYFPEYRVYEWDKLKDEDDLWYCRLVRDCVR